MPASDVGVKCVPDGGSVNLVYFRLIRTIGSMGVASVGYLKPAVGVLIGCALMGEALTWTTGAGLIAILIGVAAINQTDSQGALSRLGRLQPIQNDGSNGPLVLCFDR